MTKWVGQYFKDDEFACQCRCGAKLVHLRLVEILDSARKILRTPLEITSGVRCLKHNDDVGGKPNSYHKPQAFAVDGSSLDLGFAADVTFARAHQRQMINIARLYMALEKAGRPTNIGLGLYKTWVHVDVRGLIQQPSARWESGFPWPRL